MKRYLLLIATWLFLAAPMGTTAQEPLYIVNGVQHDDIRTIPPDQIERTEMLPADEHTIALYGRQAAGGVILVTLRYDHAAEFSASMSFADYLSERIKWGDNEPVARVIVRYVVSPEGDIVIDKVLEATDARLRRRTIKAIEESPSWLAATKNSTPVASQGVVRIELPRGKVMPHEREVVWR